jgi:WD40 repeat protein
MIKNIFKVTLILVIAVTTFRQQDLLSSSSVTLTPFKSFDYGRVNLMSAAWSPNGEMLALGGNGPISTSGTIDFMNDHELRVCHYLQGEFKNFASSPYKPYIFTVAWSPNGKHLVVGGNTGSAANASDLQVFSITGKTSMVMVASVDYGYDNHILNAAWSPDGKFIAFGGDGAQQTGGFNNKDGLRIYGFDGVTLTPVTSQSYGPTAPGGYGCQIFQVAWSPDGKTLAIGGFAPAVAGGFNNTHGLRLYSFDGKNLTPLTSEDYGDVIYALAWSPDGSKLAVGGIGVRPASGIFANNNSLRIYNFAGGALTPVASDSCGPEVRSIKWFANGKSLIVAGRLDPNNKEGFGNQYEVKIYGFDNQALTPLAGQSYGNIVFTVALSPDEKILVVGGNPPAANTGGFTDYKMVRVYALSSQDKNPTPAPVVPPAQFPKPAPVALAVPVAVLPAKPDYSVNIQRIKNRISKIKEECDRLRKEIENLNQALTNLKSGNQDPIQASMSVCEQSKTHLAKRLAFIEQDRAQLKEQLLQALEQMRALMERIKQGKPVTIEIIEQKAPIAAAPVAELYVPAAQAAAQKKAGVKNVKKGKKAAKKNKKPKAKKSKKAAKKAARGGVQRKGSAPRKAPVKKSVLKKAVQPVKNKTAVKK